MRIRRKFEVNLEWPFLLLAGLIAWRYGGYVTAQVVAWAMAAMLLVSFALLSLVASTNPYHSSVQIGGVKVESRISPLPSRRTRLSLGMGVLALVYLAWHGHPWALVGALTLLLQLLGDPFAVGRVRSRRAAPGAGPGWLSRDAGGGAGRGVRGERPRGRGAGGERLPADAAALPLPLAKGREPRAQPAPGPLMRKTPTWLILWPSPQKAGATGYPR